MESSKVDNNPIALAAKLGLRERVLEKVRPARVFDCCCGVDGEMWGAWEHADSYLGCDVRYRVWDHRHRVVSDYETALRAFDLQRFNVFDVDVYGEPWVPLFLIATRRKWAPKEIGAVVITDGSHLSVITHRRSAGLGEFGFTPDRLDGASCRLAHEVGVRELCDRMSVRPLFRWVAQGQTVAHVRYSAMVFEGI